MMCKRYSFECDTGKYSTRPMSKLPYSLDECCFFHIAQKMNNACFFSHDQVTHDITATDYRSFYYRQSAMLPAATDVCLIVKIIYE